MEVEQAFQHSRWRILEALAGGDAAATEIAQRAGTSLPNVSQQARLLEAWGLIRHGKEEKEGPGKPKLRYGLAKELAFVALIRKGYAAKRMLALDPFHMAIMNIWCYEKSEEHYYLQKFFWQNEEYIRECLGIAVVESRGNEIHLLVIASPEKLEILRKKFSKVEVSSPDGERKRSVISWTHSLEEIREGIGRKDDYYRNLVKRLHVVIDRDGAFAEIM